VTPTRASSGSRPVGGGDRLVFAWTEAAAVTTVGAARARLEGI